MYRMPPPEFYERARKEIGRRIRQTRKTRDWTQEQLAEATGMNSSQISKFERGKQSMHLRTLLKIAYVLGVDPADLVHGLRLPGGDDPAAHALLYEQQRHQQEVATAKLEAAERLAALETVHEQRIASISRSLR